MQASKTAKLRKSTAYEKVKTTHICGYSPINFYGKMKIEIKQKLK